MSILHFGLPTDLERAQRKAQADILDTCSHVMDAVLASLPDESPICLPLDEALQFLDRARKGLR